MSGLSPLCISIIKKHLEENFWERHIEKVNWNNLSENENINPNEIDNVFVIRKCKRRADEDIDPNVVKDIYNTIKDNLSSLKLNTLTVNLMNLN